MREYTDKAGNVWAAGDVVRIRSNGDETPFRDCTILMFRAAELGDKTVYAHLARPYCYADNVDTICSGPLLGCENFTLQAERLGAYATRVTDGFAVGGQASIDGHRATLEGIRPSLDEAIRLLAANDAIPVIAAGEAIRRAMALIGEWAGFRKEYPALTEFKFEATSRNFAVIAFHRAHPDWVLAECAKTDATPHTGPHGAVFQWRILAVPRG